MQAAVPEAYIVQMAGEGREVYIQLEAWVEVTLQFLAMKISM